jgi:hypothetical protein
VAAKVRFGKVLSIVEHNINFKKLRLFDTLFSAKECEFEKGILKFTVIGALRSIILSESSYNQMKVQCRNQPI